MVCSNVGLIADILYERLNSEVTISNDVSIALQQWHGYVEAKRALLKSGVLRSFKAPEADLSEWLIATLLTGSLASNKSQPSFDVLAGDKRVQVKSLCKASDNPNGYIVSARDRSNSGTHGASHYAFVFFDDLELQSAYLVPEDVVRSWNRTQIRQKDLAVHHSAVRLWPVEK